MSGSGFNSDDVLIYVLKDVTSYATPSGEIRPATHIELRAPSSKNSDECAFLMQALTQSLQMPTDMDAEKLAALQASVEEAKATRTTEGFTGSEVMMVLSRSTTVKLSEVINTAREMFVSKQAGVAFVDGETRMTRPIADAMSWKDVQGMTGDYIARFVAASLTEPTPA